jgi:transcription initiation factor TFIIIB Brf1 subunit/transcription initiation factor TFIIB
MPDSKCPKCNNTSFELVQKELTNSPQQYQFIQCASCGCVVGISDIPHMPSLVKSLADTINKNITNLPGMIKK